MNQRVLYIVTASLGDPDDYDVGGHLVIGARWKHSQAKALIEEDSARNKAERQAVKDRWEKQRQVYDHRGEWKKANPEPELDKSLLKQKIKWQSLPGQRQVITDEMRAERQAVLDYNEGVHEEWRKQYRAWDAVWKVEEGRFIAEKGWPPDIMEREEAPAERSYGITETLVPDLED